MKLPAPGLGRGVLAVALVQGLLGDALFRVQPMGLNLALWSAAGVVGMAIVAYRENRSLPTAAWAWLVTATACGLLFAGRDSGLLGGLNFLAGIGCLVYAAWTARGGNPFREGVVAGFVEAALTALHSFAGALAWAIAAAVNATNAALAVPPGRDRPLSPRIRPPWAQATVGGLLAVPILVVFGSLFTAADPIFARGLHAVVELDFQSLILHGVLIGGWGWVAAGYGRRLMAEPGGEWTPRLEVPAPARAPGVEVLTGLALLGLLFFAFVAVQLRYLFGDDRLVQSVAGMTYAEYARRGFFELLAVAFLLLPVLLAADWLLGKAPDRRGFQFLAGLLLGLLGVILVSAWKRLGLYTSAYGLTEARLYAGAALAWIALVALWFGATVLPGHRPRFAAGAAVTALAIVFGLHTLNPDALIARHNLARARAGLELDVQHLLHLGSGAVPTLLAGRGVLAPADQEKLLDVLADRWAKPDADWRTWNFDRARARKLISALPPRPKPKVVSTPK